MCVCVCTYDIDDTHGIRQVDIASATPPRAAKTQHRPTPHPYRRGMFFIFSVFFKLVLPRPPAKSQLLLPPCLCVCVRVWCVRVSFKIMAILYIYLYLYI